MKKEKEKIAGKKEKFETIAETIAKLNDIPASDEFLQRVVGFMRNKYWSSARPETRLQFLVYAWIKATYPDLLVVHCPNEGKRTNWEQFYIKYSGVVSGFPDLAIYQPTKIPVGVVTKVEDMVKPYPFWQDSVLSECRNYCGLAIELKIWPKQPTKNQLNCLEALRAAGWFCTICWDFPTTIKTVSEYMDHRIQQI